MFSRKSILNTIAGLPLALIGATSNALDIVDTAVSAGQFNTLVAAVEAADLVNTLKGDGPFTVFAQTRLPLLRLDRLAHAQRRVYRAQ